MDLTKMEQHLRALGAQADAGNIDAEALPQAAAASSGADEQVRRAQAASAPVESTAPGTATENGSDSGKNAAPPGDGEQREDQAGGGQAAAVTDAASESAYEKAARERREAQARQRQEADRERAELQAARAELERLRQAPASASRAAEPASPAGSGREMPAFTAADYEAAARHFGQSGDDGLARLAQHAALAQRQVEGQAQQHAFVRQWWDHVHQAVHETPELRDQASELGRAVQGILKENPLFSARPDGFRQAVALAKAQREAAGAGALRAQLETLKRENERLSKLTAITGTSPARSTGEKSSAMSERDLRRLAAEHDNE